MKTEPTTFSIDDLVDAGDSGTCWEGVRNYQVRNMLRDEFKPGDRAFLYHSACRQPGIFGSMRILTAGYPDHHARDPESPYYDPRESEENPRWYMVDVAIDRKFERPVYLATLRETPELADMQLLRRGNRLSITPLSPDEWNTICKLGKVR